MPYILDVESPALFWLERNDYFPISKRSQYPTAKFEKWRHYVNSVFQVYAGFGFDGNTGYHNLQTLMYSRFVATPTGYVHSTASSTPIG